MRSKNELVMTVAARPRWGAEENLHLYLRENYNIWSKGRMTRISGVFCL